MKKVFGVRTFVAVALVSSLALGSTGCRSGWKVSNPFSKAPKAAAETPSELDDMELTPPPENYTSNERKNTDADSASGSEKSFAQTGKYDDGSDAKTDAKSTPETSSASSESALANASTAPAENFKTPSYGQDYQSTATYNVAQTAPQYGDQNAQSPQTAQTPQFNSTQSAQIAQAQPVVPNAVAAPNAAPANSTPFPAFDEFPSFETAQTNVAPNANVPANVPTNAVAPYAAPENAVAANATAAFPTAAAPANAYPTADETAYSTLNVAAQNAQAAQSGFPGTPTQTAPYAPSTQVAQTIQTSQYQQTSQTSQTARPTYVAQNVSEPASTNAAPNATPYSDVYYQPQTTSGGFAPGSSALY